MSDISSISGPSQLASKPKASLETTQKQTQIEGAAEVKEMKRFEIKMDEETNRAFALVNEIHDSLKAALHDLSPSE